MTGGVIHVPQVDFLNSGRLLSLGCFAVARNDGPGGGPDSLVLGHRQRPHRPARSRQPADETVLHELSASLVEIDGEFDAIDGDDAPRAEFYVKYSHAGLEGG